MLTDARIAEIQRLREGITPPPWTACNGGMCRCKQVWAAECPVAVIEHGEWGDSYPALRAGPDGTVEAYTEHIPYGEIPEDVAEANVVFIAASPTIVDDLLVERAELMAEIKMWRESSGLAKAQPVEPGVWDTVATYGAYEKPI